MSNIDPSTVMMDEVFAVANGAAASPDSTNRKPTAWPILVFLGFIFTAPYLIMKLLGTVSTSALEESKLHATAVKLAQICFYLYRTHLRSETVNVGESHSCSG